MARRLYDEHGREVRVRRRGGCLKWIGIGFIIFIALGVLGVWDSDEPANTTTTDTAGIENQSAVTVSESAEAVAEEVAEPAVEEIAYSSPIEQAANDTWGEQLDDIMIIEPTGRINISAQMKDNLSGSWVISGFEMDIVRFLERIQDEDFESIYIMGYFNMIDTYGNTDNRKVYDIELAKSEIEQINFESFNRENLSAIADTYQVHNAFN